MGDIKIFDGSSWVNSNSLTQLISDVQTALANSAAAASTVSSLAEDFMSYKVSTQRNVVTKTSAYSAASTDDLIQCDTSSATFAITLPATGSSGNKITIAWTVGTVAPTFAFASGAALTDTTTPTFTAIGDSLTFEWDGSSKYKVV